MRKRGTTRRQRNALARAGGGAASPKSVEPKTVLGPIAAAHDLLQKLIDGAPEPRYHGAATGMTAEEVVRSAPPIKG
jgi:hypothetical protein